MEQKLIAASVKAERWDPERQNFEETESVLASTGVRRLEDSAASHFHSRCGRKDQHDV